MINNKLILIAVAAAMLQGCAYQRIDQLDLRRAINFCGTSEQILYIHAEFSGTEYIRCINGNFIKSRKVELK